MTPINHNLRRPAAKYASFGGNNGRKTIAGKYFFDIVALLLCGYPWLHPSAIREMNSKIRLPNGPIVFSFELSGLLAEIIFRKAVTWLFKPQLQYGHTSIHVRIAGILNESVR